MKVRNQKPKTCFLVNIFVCLDFQPLSKGILLKLFYTAYYLDFKTRQKQLEIRV
jgi:hypothetical protein